MCEKHHAFALKSLQLLCIGCRNNITIGKYRSPSASGYNTSYRYPPEERAPPPTPPLDLAASKAKHQPKPSSPGIGTHTKYAHTHPPTRACFHLPYKLQAVPLPNRTPPPSFSGHYWERHARGSKDSISTQLRGPLAVASATAVVTVEEPHTPQPTAHTRLHTPHTPSPQRRPPPVP